MDIPVIYITAHDEDEIVDRAKETEPYAYLLKPVSDRALHTTINLVLHRFRTDHDREQRNRVLAHTLKSIGDPLLITDSRGFITFGNHEAAHLLGLADDRFLGYTLNEAFQVESSTGVVCDVQHLVLDQGTVYHSRVGSLLRRRDDSTIPIHFCGAPVEDQERTLLGGVFIFHDVSRSEEIRDRLEQAVMDMRQKLAVLKPIPVRLPICPHCKKIRDENGVWYPVEQFLRLHTDAEFTHGPCPDCATSYHEKD
jgi:PAS domain S-box-containing protein